MTDLTSVLRAKHDDAVEGYRGQWVNHGDGSRAMREAWRVLRSPRNVQCYLEGDLD